jgi:hypothetical protein
MAEMTEEHKTALAQGRRESAAVKAYLVSLQITKKRGRRPTPERVDELQAQAAAESDPLKRLELVQKRLDVEMQLAAPTVDVEALEAGFVEYAARYGERKGIAYAAWREVGVSPSVLKTAGISRS